MVHQSARLWGTQAALDLYRRTLQEIAALRDMLGSQIIRPTGSVRLAGLPGEPGDQAEAADAQAEQADCDTQYEFLQTHGIAVERYNGRLGRGLLLPDDAAMNPVRRAVGLAERYRGQARLFECSPVTAVRSGHVGTERGTVSCGAIVVAVDGRLDLLLPQLAGRVRTVRLQMLATEPAADVLPWPVYGRWGYDYAQQDSAGRLFVGGGRDRFVEQEWTHDDQPTSNVQGWIEQVARRFAGGPVLVRHRWAASVGYTEDGRALVTEAAPGVAACGGYSGTGNLVGPIAARAAVALALDGKAPPPYFAS
jgi:glycine/D-amino acid oxidase-like deaminating enzyme